MCISSVCFLTQILVNWCPKEVLTCFTQAFRNVSAVSIWLKSVPILISQFSSFSTSCLGEHSSWTRRELFMVHMRTVALSPSTDWRAPTYPELHKLPLSLLLALLHCAAATNTSHPQLLYLLLTFTAHCSHTEPLFSVLLTQHLCTALTYPSHSSFCPSLSFCPFPTLTAFVLGFVLAPTLSKQQLSSDPQPFRLP